MRGSYRKCCVFSAIPFLDITGREIEPVVLIPRRRERFGDVALAHAPESRTVTKEPNLVFTQCGRWVTRVALPCRRRTYLHFLPPADSRACVSEGPKEAL